MNHRSATRRAFAGVGLAATALLAQTASVSAGNDRGPSDLATTTAPTAPTVRTAVVTPTTIATGDVIDNDRADDLAPAPGTLTCEDGCVREALLTNEVGPGVRLDIETFIPTAINLWVTDEAHPPVDGQLPAEHVELVLSLGDYVTERSEVIDGLAPDTTYWFALQVMDDFGTQQLLVDSLTTDGMGQFDSGFDPSGCLVSCITQATFTPTADGLASTLHVETHTSAELWLWTSPGPFAVDGYGQLLPLDQGDAVASTDGLDQVSWTTEVTLPFDTALHVAVGARDLNGNMSYEAGEYHTPAAPMLQATYRRVIVSTTGDGADNGEFGFVWGSAGTMVGYNSLDSSRGSAGIHSFGHPTVEVSAAATMDVIQFAMTETDGDFGEVCFNEGAPMPVDAYWADSCHLHINPLTPLQFFGTTFLELPECEDVGYPEWAGERCLIADSLEPGSQYPEYQLVVTVQLAP